MNLCLETFFRTGVLGNITPQITASVAMQALGKPSFTDAKALGSLSVSYGPIQFWSERNIIEVYGFYPLSEFITPPDWKWVGWAPSARTRYTELLNFLEERAIPFEVLRRYDAVPVLRSSGGVWIFCNETLGSLVYPKPNTKRGQDLIKNFS
jgi:hypothetical protein